MIHHITLPDTSFHAYVDPEDIDIETLLTKLYRTNGGTMSKGKPKRPSLWPVVHTMGECDECVEHPARVR